MSFTQLDRYECDVCHDVVDVPHGAPIPAGWARILMPDGSVVWLSTPNCAMLLAQLAIDNSTAATPSGPTGPTQGTPVLSTDTPTPQTAAITNP